MTTKYYKAKKIDLSLFNKNENLPTVSAGRVNAHTYFICIEENRKLSPGVTTLLG